MNHHETRALLRARSALTSQPYGDDAVDVWQHALEDWTLDECRTALVKSSREHDRVTVAHLVERLPHKPRPGTSTQIRYPWHGPTDKGRAIAAQIREHIEHRTDPNHHCPICPQ